MNREIKFRAWDKRCNSMVDPLGHFIEFDGSVWFNDCDFYKNDSLCDQKDNLIVMQYTGLKDKNGKEIYESDILLEAGTELYVQVIWGEYEGSWQTCIPNNPDFTRDLICSVKECAEVIGNIYEHADLLEAVA